jgi:hypothetical protein
MIRKSGSRFSEKIMLKQQSKARFGCRDQRALEATPCFGKADYAPKQGIIRRGLPRRPPSLTQQKTRTQNGSGF